MRNCVIYSFLTSFMVLWTIYIRTWDIQQTTIQPSTTIPAIFKYRAYSGPSQASLSPATSAHITSICWYHTHLIIVIFIFSTVYVLEKTKTLLSLHRTRCNTFSRNFFFFFFFFFFLISKYKFQRANLFYCWTAKKMIYIKSHNFCILYE